MPASKTPAILSRRALIAACIGGVVAAGALAAPFRRPFARPESTGRSWWRAPTVSLSKGSFFDWSRQRGSMFTVMGETGAVAVRLAEVTAMGSEGRRAARLGRDRAFAVHFEAVGGQLPAGDRVYTVRSARQGPMNIYFSPTAQTMVAIFG